MQDPHAHIGHHALVILRSPEGRPYAFTHGRIKRIEETGAKEFEDLPPVLVIVKGDDAYFSQEKDWGAFPPEDVVPGMWSTRTLHPMSVN